MRSPSSRPVPSRVDEKVQFQSAPHFMALLRSLLRSRASTVRVRARDITRVVSSDASSATFEFGDAQARYYDDVLVDGIFKPWTESMFETSRPVAGDRVLDVATGTGVVAREIARAVAAVPGSQRVVMLALRATVEGASTGQELRDSLHQACGLIMWASAAQRPVLSLDSCLD